VARSAVGAATLSFSGADSGAFTYSVKGAPTRTKPIARIAFGPLPACTFLAQPDFALAANYQGLWWAPGGAESGWGLALAHQGDVIFASWFTYGLDGTPLWLTASATKAAPGVYTGSLIQTAGPAFDAVPFDPARVTRTPVGSVTLAFTDGNAAAFSYAVNGIAQTKAITRQLFYAPAGVACR
jgi:hypothetical protein